MHVHAQIAILVVRYRQDISTNTSIADTLIEFFIVHFLGKEVVRFLAAVFCNIIVPCTSPEGINKKDSR
jgi:hypothetical protein